MLQWSGTQLVSRQTGELCLTQANRLTFKQTDRLTVSNAD